MSMIAGLGPALVMSPASPSTFPTESVYLDSSRGQFLHVEIYNDKEFDLCFLNTGNVASIVDITNSDVFAPRTNSTNRHIDYVSISPAENFQIELRIDDEIVCPRESYCIAYAILSAIRCEDTGTMPTFSSMPEEPIETFEALAAASVLNQ